MLLTHVQSFIKILQAENIHFCVIGGIAVLLHGGRASTVDFDFYILSKDSEKLLKSCKKRRIKITELGPYQLRADYKGLQVDVLISDPDLGDSVIDRSIPKKLGKFQVPVATPEDLIIMKTLSDRTLDRRDVEELKEIFENNLDQDYITQRLSALNAKLKE